MTHDLPDLALSVRQPWAWAILHGKDIENRSKAALKHMPGIVGRRIALHAAKGMTRDEYEWSRQTIVRILGTCPRPDELLRGGIIGSVDVVGIVSPPEPARRPAARRAVAGQEDQSPATTTSSPWWMGDWGLKLREARACDFIACAGALGLFPWSPPWRPPSGSAEPPAKWMVNWGRPVPAAGSAEQSRGDQQGKLF